MTTTPRFRWKVAVAAGTLTGVAVGGFAFTGVNSSATDPDDLILRDEPGSIDRLSAPVVVPTTSVALAESAKISAQRPDSTVADRDRPADANGVGALADSPTSPVTADSPASVVSPASPISSVSVASPVSATSPASVASPASLASPESPATPAPPVTVASPASPAPTSTLASVASPASPASPVSSADPSSPDSPVSP